MVSSIKETVVSSEVFTCQKISVCVCLKKQRTTCRRKKSQKRKHIKIYFFIHSVGLGRVDKNLQEKVYTKV